MVTPEKLFQGRGMATVVTQLIMNIIPKRPGLVKQDMRWRVL